MNRERTERTYNTQNLKPFNAMSAEEHRELSRRGGIASGQRRRETRQAIQAAKINSRAELEMLESMAKLYSRLVNRH